MRKLIVGTGWGSNLSTLEEIRLIKEAGFDGVFTGYKAGQIKEYAILCKQLGLIYHSVHAPFGGMANMWEEGDVGKEEAQELIRCIEECADNNIDLVIVHTIIGMDKNSPNEIGVANFKTVIDEARKLNVTLAFENTEGECYLDLLLTRFKDDPTVRFCIDTGHEMCYNYSHDLIGKYKDKLISTHINDNNKITGDTITWFDDLHLLPFDGKNDWDNVAYRLVNANYQGPLTFEILKNSKPNKHENDIYESLSNLEYLKLAYQKALKLKKMIEKKEQ